MQRTVCVQPGSVRKGRGKGLLMWQEGQVGSGRWGQGPSGALWETDSTSSSVFTWTRHHLRPSWAFSHRSLIIALWVISNFYVHFENEKIKAQRCSELTSGSHVAGDGGEGGSELEAGQVV